MYPIIYKVINQNNKIDRIIFCHEPGVYDEYIAGDTLYHESQSEFSKEKLHVYDIPDSGKKYLAAALYSDSELIIHQNGSEVEMKSLLEKIKSQYKNTQTPKRDRKKRR
jgi:hypothetical protein